MVQSLLSIYLSFIHHVFQCNVHIQNGLKSPALQIYPRIQRTLSRFDSL